MQFFKHFPEDQQKTYLREYGENKFLGKVLADAKIEENTSDLHRLQKKHDKLRTSLEQTEMNFKRAKHIFEAFSTLTKISSIIEDKRKELEKLQATITQLHPDKLEILEEFYDPIMESVMLNPYKDKHVNTVDYENWKNHFENSNNNNPFNRGIMTMNDITPNETLRKEIQQFFQEKLAKLIENEQFIDASELLEELSAPKEAFANDRSIKQKLETLSAQIEKIDDEDMKEALRQVISQQPKEEKEHINIEIEKR
jgi:hypothetical protein